MRRASGLIVLGLVLLATAVALPVADLFTAEWDHDYRYAVPDDGFCAATVDELPAGDTTGFVHARENLSADARTAVRRAAANGSYTVETEAEAAGPFRFTSDHIARGTGCYAIAIAGDGDGDGEYLPLVTETVTHRADPFQHRAVRVGMRLAAVLGLVSLLGAAAFLLLDHRRPS